MTFFLLSTALLNTVQENDTLLVYKSDHSPVMLSLKLNEFINRKELWKFNPPLLYDNKFFKIINKKYMKLKKAMHCLYITENI